MPSAVRAPLKTSRYLGHPSLAVGLTAVAAGRSFQGTAVLHAPSIGAGSSHGVAWPANSSVFERAHMSLVELARPRSAKQTNRNAFPVFVGSRGVAAARITGLCGSAALNTCLPAPNHSIERTSQRPLRALCDTAHVER